VHGTPTQQVVDPLDQLSDQTGLPRPPGAGAGGQRIGLGQRGQQFEGDRRTHGGGHGGDGGVVGQVAPGGHVGQQQVMAHHVDQHVDVVGRQPHARPQVAHHHHADVGVITGSPLADVVEERPQHEQVGPLHTVGQRGGVGGRLHQVTVDGEAVVGVALRLALDVDPLGQHPLPDALAVE
jgi:hypothetical protein